MRTTIDLPDEVFRQVKARAALDGMKLKDLITRYVEEGLRHGTRAPVASPKCHRSELPVAWASTGHTRPDLSNADLNTILEEEEIGCG